jgi:hypothetical protein
MLAIEDGKVASYLGGWADYVRAQQQVEEAAPVASPPPKRKPKPGPPKERPPKERPPAATPLELVEREVERAEERIAELERRLAEDWADTELVSAHRAAREDLEALLHRWELLFEQAQA